MNSEKASIEEYLKTMSKSSNQNRILIISKDENEDYVFSETNLVMNQPPYGSLFKVEAGIVLRTLCSGPDKLIESEENIFQEHSLDYDKYSLLLKVHLEEALELINGSTLVEILLFYEGTLYNIQPVSNDVIVNIFDRWLYAFRQEVVWDVLRRNNLI